MVIIIVKRPKCLNQFREALDKDDVLQELKDGLNEAQITMYLRAGNWDVDAALVLLNSYVSFGRDFPECLKASCPSKCRPVWETEMLSCGPVRDMEGRRVIVMHEKLDWDPAILSPMELLATIFTLLSMLSRESKTQIAGVVVVANAKMRFLQFRYFGVQQIRCVAALLNGAVPLWFRKFHIVNHHRVFSIFYGLLRPFLNQRIRDSIVFHS